MSDHRFSKLDVFTDVPLKGNPLAVIHDADGLSADVMQATANWMNLSETTFLMQPEAQADYALRIFTPRRELPFAGHPTLGTCQAWLNTGGQPKGDTIVQSCAAGLIPIRRDGSKLAFRAPPLMRSGAVDPEVVEQIKARLGLTSDQIEATEWIDNGPGWCGVLVRDTEILRSIQPDYSQHPELGLGVIAPADGEDYDFELRGFTRAYDDPVTGSLNASAAQWLFASGIAKGNYVAAQGRELGRAGRIAITKEGDDVWVGGDVATVVTGQITL
ncbi:PhzF family phenazine biosynthesis protein [Pseudooceanicola sp. MF1-13]|uniref:PhzF family phenazine biosynthesis protein n=1 Tax=Pseudooceanicola sp. MF1-13 TaxID=3379095 RepID=UPI003892A201